MLRPKGLSFRAAAVLTAGSAAFISLAAISAPGAVAAAVPTAWHVDFTPAGTAPATGYTADTGLGYDAARGYGWISQTTSAAKTLTGRAVKRNMAADPRVDTVMHTQLKWTTTAGTATSTSDPARWELAVPNGAYDVTVAVGDPQWPDNVDSITLDGVKAIDRFSATEATKTMTKTVRVAVSDGRLTLDSAGGTNTKVAYLDVVAAPLPTSAHVDFTPAGTAPAVGYTADTGLGYDAARGYGWISQTTSAAKTLTGRAVKRNVAADPRVDTVMHTQLAWGTTAGTATSTSDPARWELALPNGTYDVTVAVGDPQWPDNVDSITLDGVKAIDRFRATEAVKTTSATVRVPVTDGRLTLDSTGGTNTKVAYLDVVPATGTPPTTTTTTTPPPPTTTTTTTPPPTTTTTPPPTTPPTSAGAKGDVNTATAEKRVVTDPHTLWMGTFDNAPDWKANWGINIFKNPASNTVGTQSFAPNGKVLKTVASGDNDGFTGYGSDFRPTFKDMGIANQDEVYFRYYVYFPGDFDWFEGGKLPGLSAISPGESAFSTSGGGDYHPTSWSGRTMWRTGGRMSSYLYVKHANGINIMDHKNPNNGRVYGINPLWYHNGVQSQGLQYLKKGAWNLVELHYKMNTPGQNNGIFEGKMNGELGLRLTDVQYRDAAHPNLNANQMFFTSFFGGPTSNNTTETWYFDDVVISNAPIGPRQ